MCNVFSGLIVTKKAKDWGKVLFLTGVHHEKDREWVKEKYGDEVLAWESDKEYSLKDGFKLTHTLKSTKKEQKELMALIEKWAKGKDEEKLLRSMITVTKDNKPTDEYHIAKDTIRIGDNMVCVCDFKINITGGDGATVTGGNGATVTGGNRATVTGGNGATVTGGYEATVTGGVGATVTGGDGATVTGGNGATVTGGYEATVTGGYEATVTGGVGATVTGGDGATVTGGDGATVTGGNGATVTGGNRATVTGGNGATVTGGNYATLIVKYYDGNRYRFKVGYVRENRIKPNVKYRLNDKNKFEAVE